MVLLKFLPCNIKWSSFFSYFVLRYINQDLLNVRTISPVENVLVSLGALGEGWHNYHHVFPYDYKTSELGEYSFNWTTAFIDMFASIGWAFDCKTVSEQMVQRRAQRCGDGSHHGLWGYGDSDMLEEDRKELDSRNSA